jgi:hypothetical protein
MVYVQLDSQLNALSSQSEKGHVIKVQQVEKSTKFKEMDTVAYVTKLSPRAAAFSAKQLL